MNQKDLFPDQDCDLISWMQSQQSTSISGLSLRDRLKNRSSLYVAATGLGKTVMMASTANHWPLGRVLVLSHRFELNQQAVKEFEKWCCEDVDMEQASYHADTQGRRCRIVVGSVQSLVSVVRNRKHHLYKKKRVEKFDPFDFGLVMIDEAHRSTANSYLKVIDHFSKNPECRFIGVTATPDRTDKIGLGNLFGHVACDYNLPWAIQEGWLVEPKQKFVQVNGLDMRSIKTVRGDLDPRELSRLVELEENLHAMAKPIVDVAGEDKQAIVFTASVSQAHRLAEMIRDYAHQKFGTNTQDRAVSIDGKMNPQDPRRRAIVSQFKEGNIQFLVNCGVATEGFDAPSVKLIAVGRPTKSRSLYTQMIGRGTRTLPGVVDGLDTPDKRKAAIAGSDKKHCTVLDFVGQSGRHKLVATTDILSTNDDPPEVLNRAKSLASRSEFDGSALDALRQAREEAERKREAARAKITVNVDYSLKDAESLYDLSLLPEVKCPGYLKNKPPTEKQAKFMLKLGFTQPQIEKMNPRQASKAIDIAIRYPRTGFAKWIHNQKKQAGEI